MGKQTSDQMVKQWLKGHKPKACPDSTRNARKRGNVTTKRAGR